MDRMFPNDGRDEPDDEPESEPDPPLTVRDIMGMDARQSSSSSSEVDSEPGLLDRLKQLLKD